MRFIKEQSTYFDENTKYLLEFIRQWEREHPEEEMVFLTLPKHNREERKRILQTTMEILEKEDFGKSKDER